MPPVNWDVFVRLPGAQEWNFEMLCRALVRHHYARYGHFLARAAQPGVEFHLKLTEDCSLGQAGRWLGWQCRWYDLPPGRALGATRRNKIEKAIKTTEAEVGPLTDWILWTRHTLTAGDQAWFYALTKKMKLTLWTSAEVEEHLSGDAAILRSTYFGELVLTPAMLVELHRRSVATVRTRWIPETHQSIDAERSLRKMLGETGVWGTLASLAQLLKDDDAELTKVSAALDASLKPFTAFVSEAATRAATKLETTEKAIATGDLDLLRQELRDRGNVVPTEAASAVRRLRGAAQVAALHAANAMATVLGAAKALNEVADLLATGSVAVLADAGVGKTQLAAQLTVHANNRPPGLLLFGRDLVARGTLDDLARRVSLHGHHVPTFEALLASLDAAGQRDRHRLPLVIDGLNESEDPRDWKGQLAVLATLAAKYPYVLCICTLRTAFAEDTLPAGIRQISVEDFGKDFWPAVARYFKYYKISMVDADLPTDLLQHPLTLRLFCEVTNPTRKNIVGIEAMPGSLSALFDRYLEQASARIAQLSQRAHRYFSHDVRQALNAIGTTLWTERARDMSMASLRTLLGDEGRPWDQSIVRAMEQEGVLLRAREADDAAGPRLAPAYDALAGHLIADAMITSVGGAGIKAWLGGADTVAALTGDWGKRHTLASDIVGALAGLCPRRLHRQQVWQMSDEPLRTQALRAAAYLEAEYLDVATVTALMPVIVSAQDQDRRDILWRLYETRAATDHPLNAKFLHQLLVTLKSGVRDARWSEWIAKNRDAVIGDLQWLEKRFREGRAMPSDRLRVLWVMWLLTSTVRTVRDQATRALYWFGRSRPARLFRLALFSLRVDDDYVPERVLAAAYGVVMANQRPDVELKAKLKKYLEDLLIELVGPEARHATNHWLIREYARRTFEFAAKCAPDALPEGVNAPEFAVGPVVQTIPKADPRRSELRSVVRMDFRNYTLGRLFSDRKNYDLNHARHEAALSYVYGVVWDLGWREALLGAADERLGNMNRDDHHAFDRYAKKYSWIGFFRYAGILEDRDELQCARLTDVDIDPSFPERPPVMDVPELGLLGPDRPDDTDWITSGGTRIPNLLLERDAILGAEGPWIAVHGHLEDSSTAFGRRIFGFVTAVLVDPGDVGALTTHLGTVDYPNQVLPEAASDYSTFAGEIPWSDRFAPILNSDDDRYIQEVDLGNGHCSHVELLAHVYHWGRDRSEVNDFGTAFVPSKLFSDASLLRSRPQSFAHDVHNGRLASVTAIAANGMGLGFLYLRRDLLEHYAAGRVLVVLAWGARALEPAPSPTPAWLSKLRRERRDHWRVVTSIDLTAPERDRRRKPRKAPSKGRQVRSKK